MFRHLCWVIPRVLITYHKPKTTSKIVLRLPDIYMVRVSPIGSLLLLTQTLCIPLLFSLVIIVFLKTLKMMIINTPPPPNDVKIYESNDN